MPANSKWDLIRCVRVNILVFVIAEAHEVICEKLHNNTCISRDILLHLGMRLLTRSFPVQIPSIHLITLNYTLYKINCHYPYPHFTVFVLLLIRSAPIFLFYVPTYILLKTTYYYKIYEQ